MSLTRKFYSTDEAERTALAEIANLAGIPLLMDDSEPTKLVISNDSGIIKTLTTLESITTYLQNFLVDYDEGTNAAAILNAAKLAQMNLTAHDNAIMNNLENRQIPYHTLEHEAVITAEDLLATVPLSEGCVHTKNLLLKDKKHGLFLVVLNAHNKDSVSINGSKVSKIIANALGLTGKVNMRMPSEDILKSTLNCSKGCLGGLCLLGAPECSGLTVVIDETLTNVPDKVYSHPADNTLSIGLKPNDFIDVITNTNENCHVISLAIDTANDTTSEKGSKKSSSNNQAAQASKKKNVEKGQTLLALQWKKRENFAQWYSDVIVLSEMISYYDISGCYILRPWSYKIWEFIQNFMNLIIEHRLGTENAYFPLFVSKDRLEKEKDHVEGFAPEVAWVTHSGTSELQVPIAIRPTSETIMYPTFANLIQSHRDLPLKLNQWSNVVRWEFKDPTPFLRSREFLWQEGHTAHATHECSTKMVRDALEMYRETYEELLAVPVIPGYKTEKEKFAGGYQTTTVEAYIPGSGRAIQGATSHDLGQNFGKMFDITYQDTQGNSSTVWQTSWGFTTRSIGVMVMVHGDDQGLVLPPRIAPLQVVIVPIYNKKVGKDQIDPYCKEIESILSKNNQNIIRVKYDDRDTYNPGWKYNHWEQKGVPLRLEVGPSDLEKRTVRCVTRFNGNKEDISIGNGDDFATGIQKKLEEIQQSMFSKAKAERDEHVVSVTEWKDFVPALEGNNLVLTPWCGGEHEEWENWVKDTSRAESLAANSMEAESETTATSVAAKTLCIPFTQPELEEGTKCIASGLPATCWVLWGRSY